MGLFNDDMTGLAAAYASMNDGKYLLTNADKVGNTPAWQNRYKVNESPGEMLYEMADHLKEAYEEELIAKIDATLEELRRIDEGKIPAGLQAYLDKKKGKKGNGDKKEEENGKDHGGSKGSKPDFLDLDKDGDKKEPMKKAAKEKKEETEYNYVNAYLGELKKTSKEEETEVVEHHQKDAEGKVIEHEEEATGTPSSVEEEKTVLEQLAENNRDIDAFEAVVSYLIDEKLAESWEQAEKIMTTLKPELVQEVYQNQLWTLFDENYRAMRNPEKYKPDDESDKPYSERSREARMKDPKRGINSPAFKKFMADRGM